jgi:hypothetical protein
MAARSSACAVVVGVTGKSRPQPLKVASQSGEPVRSSVGRFHGESAGADAGVADHDESACGEIVGDLLAQAGLHVGGR